MWTRSYDIVMHTTIGDRYGNMMVTVDEDEETLSGELAILADRTSFYGHIAPDGRCHFHGELVTLLRVLAFVAYGIVTPQSLSLRLSATGETYQLEGTALAREEA